MWFTAEVVHACVKALGFYAEYVFRVEYGCRLSLSVLLVKLSVEESLGRPCVEDLQRL